MRNPKRKTSKGSVPGDVMEAAAKRVCAGQSVRDVADESGIPKTTLHRYVAKMNTEESPRFTPNYFVNKVFSEEEEKSLSEYLLRASKHHHGLTSKETRVLAYEYAVRNKKKFPSGWNETKSATYDWLYGFMKRNPSLSIHSPEATSLSRSTSFNKTNVAAFFGNLKQVHEQHKYQAGRIFNVDETGLMTVQKPPKVIAAKGLNKLAKLLQQNEGNSIPPLLVFPRVNFKEHMLHGSPAGTVGVAKPSGWITKDLFLHWMDHFIQHASSSKENPTLLLLDNHESHCSIASIDKARDAGITLLSFPPHCSHKLQPLDRTVYGPLKTFYNAACDSWMLRNPGKRVKFDFDLRRYF
ncbi:hypothetical protein CAPTEDRAFT_207955 [Capitella teleta]|uniref:DDE-1 domain-containing protein n=1 Tax=Capitella teleta TaxID=283909 RepID=R7TRP2_CAPTE|nr:hypothetical protein CAPTEDRAFT_207955 [Capitella teleta]|eukprot:ELT93700.1 hypothetical protein CAPTEDRAFT_207955 [Capitella teleta]